MNMNFSRRFYIILQRLILIHECLFTCENIGSPESSELKINKFRTQTIIFSNGITRLFRHNIN